MPDLEVGESRTVPGTRAHSRTYTIKNDNGSYSCDCQSWRFQNRPPAYRSCKHLVAFRGAPAEALRIAPGGKSMSSSLKALLAPHWPKGKVKAPPPTLIPLTVWERLTLGPDPFGDGP